MATVQAAAERTVAASADEVFAVLSDPGRRAELLPEAYHDVRVETTAEGPVVAYTLHAGGRQRDYRMRIVASEPELRVRDEDELSTLRTEWTLSPQARQTNVRIRTSWTGASGIGGFFERTFAPRGVVRLHEQTLERLAATVRA